MSDISSNTAVKLRKAILKSAAGKYLFYIAQFVSLVTMSRMFTPEVFGVYAILHVISVFFILLSEMGIGPALINEKKITRCLRDAAFTISLLLGGGLAIIVSFSGGLVADIYSYQKYEDLLQLISFSVVFCSATIVPLALLQKETRFIRIGVSDVLSELISLMVVVFLYGVLDDVFLLALKPLVFSIFRFSFIYNSSYKTEIGPPSVAFSLSGARAIFKFSLYQSGFSVVNYLYRNFDNLMVGKFFGSGSLGIYDKAYQLMKYPLLLLTLAMGPAIQPVMSEIKGDPKEFERLHNKFVSYMSLLGLAVGVLVYFLSDIIVYLILGPQWGEVAILLEIFSITLPLQIVLSSSGGFFLGAGRADLLFKCGLFQAVVNVSSVFIGLYLGNIVYMSLAVSVAFLISFFQCYWVMGKTVLPNGFYGVIKSMEYSLVGIALFGFYVLWVSKVV